MQWSEARLAGSAACVATSMWQCNPWLNVHVTDTWPHGAAVHEKNAGMFAHQYHVKNTLSFPYLAAA